MRFARWPPRPNGSQVGWARLQPRFTGQRVGFIRWQPVFSRLRLAFTRWQPGFARLRGQFLRIAAGHCACSGQKSIFAAPVYTPLALLSRFWFSLRFALLAVSVLLVLGLNQRAVSVLRLPVSKGENRYTAPPKATVVKQKVLLEATTAPDHFVAPPAVAWLPAAVPALWLPALRRALAVPRLRAGVRAGEVFRARLLAVALSPQAP